jgi:hypothetical protein
MAVPLYIHPCSSIEKANKKKRKHKEARSAPYIPPSHYDCKHRVQSHVVVGVAKLPVG